MKTALDNVLLRYALNMATEKNQFTGLLGGGRIPTSTLVPPVPGYLKPADAEVIVDGYPHDVLKFNVEAARVLLVKAGFNFSPGHRRPLELTYHFPTLSDARLKAELLQQQWRRNLGIRLNFAMHGFSLHWRMVIERGYSGVADYAFLMTYADPNPYLDPFLTPGVGNPTGWTDSKYVSTLADANRTLNSQERMAKLANSERLLLRAMPIVPLYFDALTFLQKPFVRGLTSNPFDLRAFKYVWIRSKWKPE
jgi:ABC-type oligopeptide transport system substrate-binding subunit